jgi:hypothetical protein
LITIRFIFFDREPWGDRRVKSPAGVFETRLTHEMFDLRFRVPHDEDPLVGDPNHLAHRKGRTARQGDPRAGADHQTEQQHPDQATFRQDHHQDLRENKTDSDPLMIQTNDGTIS